MTVRKRTETPTVAAPEPGTGAPTGVQIEASGWATRFVGGIGAGRRVFDEPLTEPGTVRSVLRGLTNRFPELAEALWHGDELGEHIEVIVNDAVLGIDHTLDSRLRPGDRITLVGQYLGG
jgi:hypothetical protein